MALMSFMRFLLNMAREYDMSPPPATLPDLESLAFKGAEGWRG
jgi:hypothetical protein